MYCDFFRIQIEKLLSELPKGFLNMAKTRKRHKPKTSTTKKNLRQLAQPKEFRIYDVQAINPEPLQEIIVWLKKIEFDQ